MTYHAIQRAFQRYEIALYDHNGVLFERWLREGDRHVIRLAELYPGTSLWGIRTHHQWIAAVLNDLSGDILTFFPRRRLNPYRKVLRAHRNLHKLKEEERYYVK